MTTTIHANGSKWAGQQPDPLSVLLDMLEREPLCLLNRSAVGPTCHYGGNFGTVSHVFNITTDDPEVIEALDAAALANLSRRPVR